MRPWQLRLAVLLIAISATLYTLHLLIFRDPYNLGFYFLIDLAFVFISTLLVVVIVEQVLEGIERRNLLGKVNQVIGVFFSEVGLELLSLFLRADRRGAAKDPRLLAKADWGGSRFADAERLAGSLDLDASPDPEVLVEIKALLLKKRDFLMRLMENPNLLEHDRFTDLLLSVFHLNEELEMRGNIAALPKPDLDHLANDSKRAYSNLVVEWLDYLRYLQANYPYLYSLAVRTNPLDPDADPVFRS